MSHFYKKCKNPAKNERILGTDEAQIEQVKEQGRSMVEMLGVLAVVGVLSIGAISGYRYAMNKYRANQVINELNLLAHQVAVAMMSKNGVSGELKLGEPYDSGKLTSSGYAFAAGCGENAEKTTTCDGQTQYSMKISGLSQSVCEEAQSQGRYLQYINEVSGNCVSGDANSLLFQFDAEKTVQASETEETTQAVSISDEWIPISSSYSFEPKLDLPEVEALNCNGRGYAYYGACICSTGSGPHCEYPSCPNEQVWDTAADACVTCPTGTKYESATQKCVTCLAGKGDVCGCTSNSDCAAGEYCYLREGYSGTDEFGPEGNRRYGECHNASAESVSFGSWIASTVGMTHQSAERFCQALGNKHLIETKDLGCSETICYSGCSATYGRCNATGSVNDYNFDPTKWAPKVKALYDTLYNQLGMNVVWTGTPGSSDEYAYGVYLNNDAYLYYGNLHYNYGAVCQ